MPVVKVSGPNDIVHKVNVPDSFMEMSPEMQGKKLNEIMPSLLSPQQTEMSNQYTDTAQKEDDIGFFEGTANALGRGGNILTSALYVQANRAGLIDDKTMVDQIALDAQDLKKYPMSESVRSGLEEIQSADTFSEAFVAGLSNPGAAFDTSVQSIVSSIPGLAGMIAGGAVGFAAGGPLGALLGTGVGSGAGSYAVEWSNTVLEEMQKNGVDPSNKTQVYDFFNDPVKMAAASKLGEERGLSIAAFDAISAGIAGKLLKPVSKLVVGSEVSREAAEAGAAAAAKATQASLRQSIAKDGLSPDVHSKLINKRAASAAAKAKQVAESSILGTKGFVTGSVAELGVQAGFGGAGEAAAQLVSEGQITSPGDVVLEMFAEGPTSVAEIGIGLRSNRKNNEKLIKAGIINNDMISETYSDIKAADDTAPEGAMFQQEIKTAEGNIIKNFMDANNNIIGTNETIGDNLLNVNIDRLEDSDQAVIEEQKVFSILENGRDTGSFFNTQEEADIQVNDLKEKNKNVTFSTGEKVSYGLVIKDINGNQSSMASGNIENIERAEGIADYINNKKAEAIATRNNNFNRIRALYSLNKKKNLNLSIEDLKNLSDEEINQEIESLPEISANSFAKVMKVIAQEASTKTTKSTSMDRKKIISILEQEEGVDSNAKSFGFEIDNFVRDDIQEEATLISNELINRGVINNKFKVINPFNVSENNSPIIKQQSQKQSEGLEPYINQNQVDAVESNATDTQANIDMTNYTPEFQKQLKEFKINLQSQLRGLLTDSGVNSENVDVEFVNRIDKDTKGSIIENVNGRLLIKIAVEGQIKENSITLKKYFDGQINHEAFHILSELAKTNNGPLTQSDINQLRKYTKQVRDPNSSNDLTYYKEAEKNYKDIKEYQKPDGSPDEVLIFEEAMANAYKDWSDYTNGQLSNKNTDIGVFDALYTKINNFFKFLKQSLPEQFKTADSIFRKIGDPKIVDSSFVYDAETGERKEKSVIDAQNKRRIEEIESKDLPQETKDAAIKALQKKNTVLIPITEKNRRNVANLRNKIRNQDPFKRLIEDNIAPTNGGTYGEAWLKEGMKVGWLEGLWRKVRINMFDNLDPLLHISNEAAAGEADLLADQSAYIAAQMAKNAYAITSGAFGSATTQGVAGPPVYEKGYTSNKPYTEIIEGEEVTVAGVIDNIGEVIENKTEEQFYLYYLAHRNLELIQAGLETSINESQANEVIQTYNEKYPYFNLARKKMISYNKKLVEYKFATGLISEQVRDQYLDSPHYISMEREGFNDNLIDSLGKNKFISTGSQDIGPSLTLDNEELVELEVNNGKFSSFKNPKHLKGPGTGYTIRIETSPGNFEPLLRENGKLFVAKNEKSLALKLKTFDLNAVKIEVRKGRPVKNMFENQVAGISQTIQDGMKNVAAQRMARDFLKLNMAYQVDNASEGNASFKMNGETINIQVDDPKAFQSLMILNEDKQPQGDLVKAILKVSTTPANILREMVTKDPGFMIANFLRDSLSAYMLSGTNAAPWKSAAGWVRAMRDDPSKLILLQAGIKGSFDFAASGDESAIKEISKLRKAKFPRGAKEKSLMPLRSVWNFLERQTENSDLATRIAVFNDALERTGNEAQAVWEAQEVLNFRRHGAYLRTWSAITPFVNARLQGLDVLMRGIIGNPAAAGAGTHKEAIRKKLFVRASIIGSLTVLLYLMSMDDDELERVPDRTRDNNWVITYKMLGLEKYKDPDSPPVAFKLPIPFEIGIFIKTIPERLAALAMGDDLPSDTRKSFSNALSSTFAVAYPTVLVPFIAAAANIDTLTGQPVLSPSQQAMALKDPLSVTNDRTSEIDITLAKVMNAGPIIDKITPVEITNIRQRMFGTIPGYFVTLFDAFAPSDVQKPDLKLTDAPIFRRFLQDVSETTSQNQNISDIYDLGRDAQSVVAKLSRIISEPNSAENSDKFIRENINILGKKEAITDTIKSLNDLRQYKKTILAMRKDQITKERKTELINDVNRSINLYEDRIKRIKKYKVDE